jgi:hypothetical protein
MLSLDVCQQYSVIVIDTKKYSAEDLQVKP